MKIAAFILAFFLFTTGALPAAELAMEKFSRHSCEMKCCMKMHTKEMPKKKCCGTSQGCDPQRCCYAFCCSVLPGDHELPVRFAEFIPVLNAMHSCNAEAGHLPGCWQPPELS